MKPETKKLIEAAAAFCARTNFPSYNTYVTLQSALLGPLAFVLDDNAPPDETALIQLWMARCHFHSAAALSFGALSDIEKALLESHVRRNIYRSLEYFGSVRAISSRHSMSRSPVYSEASEEGERAKDMAMTLDVPLPEGW